MKNNNNRIKIFVSSYACEPNLGSEIGVGWHWVLEMNKYFELWVLTRQSNKKHIEDWLKENPQEHEIHWLYYDTPYWMRWWKKGLRGVRLYYMLWQQMSDHLVKQVMRKENIEIFHLLTYGNALWPISPFGQKKFFIWGPVGGVDSIPKEYSDYYSPLWQRTEAKRRLMVKLLRFNPIFNMQCKNANLILCKSDSLYVNIPNKYQDKAVLFTDVAVEPVNQMSPAPQSNDGLVTFIQVGRLEAWRGFDLAIEAFKRAVSINPNIRLKIIGKGTEYHHIQTLIENLSMGKYIKMLGKVSVDVYHEELNKCDCVLNPSLKEGAVTVAFETMAYKKPLICIDTGGYTKYFDDECAIVIPRLDRETVIQRLADAIIAMTDSELRERLATASHDRGLKYTWEHKGIMIKELVINAFNS